MDEDRSVKTEARTDSATGGKREARATEHTVGAGAKRVREAKGISQRDLAEAAGLSQSYISKLENSPKDGGSLADLGRIASALDVPLVELLEGTSLANWVGPQGDEFLAFCPNPFCKTNKYFWNHDSGHASVRWESAATYDAVCFEETNFCGDCGRRLVKQCPSCKASLANAGERFCRRCGKRIHEYPTEKEWKMIRKELSDDDGNPPPSSDIPF